MAAIYMWFDNEEMVLTTTLYPVEVEDNLQLNVSLSSGSLEPIPLDEVDVSYSIGSISVDEILLTAPPVDDDADVSYALSGIEVKTVLLSASPVDDDADASYNIVNVEVLSKLVIADTPDEELQLACSIDPTGCSMTPV